RETGCSTIFIATVPASQITIDVDAMIDIPVGPEAIMGSTRMKSATAQKMVLNMLTTGAMVRLGKVYENVMVDLQLSKKKLGERSKRMIMSGTDAGDGQAAHWVEEADGRVRTAMVMGLTKVNREEARKKLEDEDGFIRRVLQQTSPQ